MPGAVSAPGPGGCRRRARSSGPPPSAVTGRIADLERRRRVLRVAVGVDRDLDRVGAPVPLAVARSSWRAEHVVGDLDGDVQRVAEPRDVPGRRSSRRRTSHAVALPQPAQVERLAGVLTRRPTVPSTVGAVGACLDRRRRDQLERRLGRARVVARAGRGRSCSRSRRPSPPWFEVGSVASVFVTVKRRPSSARTGREVGVGRGRRRRRRSPSGRSRRDRADCAVSVSLFVSVTSTVRLSTGRQRQDRLDEALQLRVAVLAGPALELRDLRQQLLLAAHRRRDLELCVTVSRCSRCQRSASTEREDPLVRRGVGRCRARVNVAGRRCAGAELTERAVAGRPSSRQGSDGVASTTGRALATGRRDGDRQRGRPPGIDRERVGVDVEPGAERAARPAVDERALAGSCRRAARASADGRHGRTAPARRPG